MFNNKKNGVTARRLLGYKHLKPKLRVSLTGYTIAMVASAVMKITKTYSPITGHYFDTIIVAATNKTLTRT